MPRLRWLLRVALDVAVAVAFMAAAYRRGLAHGDRIGWLRGWEQRRNAETVR